MMDWLFIVLGGILLVSGFVFCFIPLISGPLLAFIGFLVAKGIGTHAAPSWLEIAIAGGITLLAVAADYVVPILGARQFKCSKAGLIGCTLGMVVGLFFMPFGIVLGPFLGAFGGELIAGKRFFQSFKGAFGALLGFFAGIFLKLLCCGILTIWFLRIVLNPCI